MDGQSLAAGKELLQTLEAAPAILTDLIRAIPPERFEVRRKPHFWTIRDHVSHLASVQPMLAMRIERFRDEAMPNFVPYLPSDDTPAEEQPTLDVEAALKAFGEGRKRQIELIAALPKETWTKRGAHPEFELYTASILVRHIAMHDHWHMYRIEELWITKDEYLTEVS